MLNNSTNNSSGFKPPNLTPAGTKKLVVIAPSPVKPIAPKENLTKPSGNQPTAQPTTTANSSIQPGQIPKNIISAAQLQQQQQQYITQQHFQQQFLAYQAQQLQQRQLQQQQIQQQQQGPIYVNNINAGNIRMPIVNQQQKTSVQSASGASSNVSQQNMTYIMSALKQQQQQQQQVSPANLNTSAREGQMPVRNQQIMPTQQLLQYLSNVSHNNTQQAKNPSEQKDSIPINKKPLAPAPANKAPPPIYPKPSRQDKPATTSINHQPQPLKPKPANQSMVQQQHQQAPSNKNQMNPSVMAPTIYQASTNDKGQIVFSAVEPSAATNAALAAYQKQLQQNMTNVNQQAHKNVAPMPFGPHNITLPPEQSLVQRLNQASTSIAQASNTADSMKTKETEKITDSLRQQEILKQRLHQEELKYLKLQAKLNKLQSNSHENKPANTNESASKKSPDLDGSLILKNLVSNEINKISTKTVEKNDSMEVDSNTSIVEYTQSSNSNTTTGSMQTSHNAPSRNSLATDNSKKRRGRPRLYEVDPLTQKSIKSKPLAPKVQPQPKASPKETSANSSDERCHIIFQPNINSPGKLPTENGGNHGSKELSSPTSSSMSFATAYQNEEKNKEEIIVDISAEKDTYESMSADSYSFGSYSESDTDTDTDTDAQQEQEIQSIIQPKHIQPKQLENIRSIQKAIRSSIDDTIEDVINRNNVSSNSEKENEANKSLKEISSTVNNNSNEKNEEIFSTIRKQYNSGSPTSPFSASTNSSKSSRSVSPSSITSSAKKRNNSNLIESVKNINKIPVGTDDKSVILTHVIEGFVIKESGQPFAVKQNTETVKREEYEKKLERCEEEIKARLEELHASRKKYMEELEKPYVPLACPKEQPPISPTGNVENKLPGELKPPTNLGDPKIDKMHNSANSNHLEDATNKACLNISNSQLNRSWNNCTPDRLNLSNGHNASNHNLMMFNSTSPKNQQFNQSASQLNLSKINDGDIPSGDPVEWSDEDVYQFVKIVAGVSCAEIFRVQEVDGTALSLIRDDHLVNAMHIKLGPALKIMSKFNEVRSRFNANMMA